MAKANPKVADDTTQTDTADLVVEDSQPTPAVPNDPVTVTETTVNGYAMKIEDF